MGDQMLECPNDAFRRHGCIAARAFEVCEIDDGEYKGYLTMYVMLEILNLKVGSW